VTNQKFGNHETSDDRIVARIEEFEIGSARLDRMLKK